MSANDRGDSLENDEPEAIRPILGQLRRAALLSFQQALGQLSSQNLAEDEKEFIMAMIKSWEEGRAEARAEGSTNTRAHDVLTVLRARGIAVPDAARERILAQRDLEQLERWLEKAAVASSIGEVLGDPS